MLHLIDDEDKAIVIQIDIVLHLKGLPTTILRPQQIVQKHYSLCSSCTLYRESSRLNMNHFTKNINYDASTNHPAIHTEAILKKLHALIQDGGTEDSLTFSKRHLLLWYRLLAHADFENIKDFPRKFYLLKDIANCKTSLYPFCI